MRGDARAAHAGPGLPPGQDDAVYPDMARAAPPRRVEVTITDQGPQPRDIQASGGEELALRALEGSARPAAASAARSVYAADILARLSETEFATQEGTLYPLLGKLRRTGLLDYEWVESEAGPPRKYYRLTGKGKTWLAELNGYWKTLHATVDRIGG